jgi:hypothetical protein
VPLDLRPAPGSVPSLKSVAIPKNYENSSKRMRGFAPVCRVEDSKVISLS